MRFYRQPVEPWDSNAKKRWIDLLLYLAGKKLQQLLSIKPALCTF